MAFTQPLLHGDACFDVLRRVSKDDNIKFISVNHIILNPIRDRLMLQEYSDNNFREKLKNIRAFVIDLDGTTYL